jgi:hypothetical protein
MEVYKGGKTSEGKILLLRPGLVLDIKANVLQFVPEAAGAAIQPRSNQDLFPFLENRRSVSTGSSRSARLPDYGYGSLEISNILNICPKKYTDV